VQPAAMGWPHVAGVASVLLLGVVAVAGNAPALLDGGKGAGVVPGSVLLATFYAVVSLTIFAYFRVVTADPGRPCGLQSPHLESGRAANGKEMRMCQKCKTYKPERCHHCSDCNQCTLKMDHHCPWVNNCVGFRNYKYFYLLLVYATCSEVYAVGLLSYCVSLRAGGGAWLPWDICAMVTIGLVGLFALATIGLLLFHTHLISVNQTTIEQLKGIPVDEYSLGVCLNIKMVLGDEPAVWCIPCVWGVAPEFDGINWDDPAQRAAGGGQVSLEGIALDIAPGPPFPHGAAFDQPSPLSGGFVDGFGGDGSGVGSLAKPAGLGAPQCDGKTLDPNAALGNGHARLDAASGLPAYEASAMLAPPPSAPEGAAEAAQPPVPSLSLLRSEDGAGLPEAPRPPAPGMSVPAYSVNL